MEEVDLRELFNVFWRKKFIVLAILVVFIIAGLIYTYKIIEPEYKSYTTLILGRINYVDVNTDDTNAISQQEISINSNLVSTYSELIKSDTLIRTVLNNLQREDINEKELKKSIDVTRKSDTELIEIAVKNEDPELAASIANEISKVFSEKVEEIYKISNVYTIDPAMAMSEPYNINHTRDIVISILLGLLVSLGYALVVSMLDNTVRTPQDVENGVGLKTLISIPKMDKEKEETTELITFSDGKSIVSETFKTLRTNVQFTNINKKENKIMLITSCYPSEGKSYVSANLAVTFAQTGKKVILIDADMRRGRQSKVFNKPNTLGLSNYLSNLDSNGIEIHESLSSFITETDIPNLSIITSGNIPPNPSELLDSDRLFDLVKELDGYFDTIIFDGPPVLPVADSLILARISHSTLIVALAGKTKKEELTEVKNSILNVGGRIIGVALNKVNIDSYKYEKKSYYYYSQDEDIKKKKRFNIIKVIKHKIEEYKNKRRAKLLEDSYKTKKVESEEESKKENENSDNYSLFENKEENKPEEIKPQVEIKQEVKKPEEVKVENVSFGKEEIIPEIKIETKAEEKKESIPEEKKDVDVEVVIDDKEELTSEDKKEDAFNKVYNEKIRQITDSFKAFKESLVKDSKNISTYIKDKNDQIKNKIEEDKKEKETQVIENETKIIEEEMIKEREESSEAVKDEVIFDENDKKLEDELFKRELEEAERMKALEEEKAKYSEAKQKQKEERKKIREEKLKERREKRRQRKEERDARRQFIKEERTKQKQEAKINEDILEDNLYPKTKDYKDL